MFRSPPLPLQQTLPHVLDINAWWHCALKLKLINCYILFQIKLIVSFERVIAKLATFRFHVVINQQNDWLIGLLIAIHLLT